MQEQFKPFVHPVNLFNNEDLVAASSKLSLLMQGRRSVRTFSDKPIPAEVIHNLVRIAASAPSGAHKQPWTFCVITNDEIKLKIREAAEKEEFINYHGRMGTWQPCSQ
jgi:iodotyrosine deiodinase